MIRKLFGAWLGFSLTCPKIDATRLRRRPVFPTIFVLAALLGAGVPALAQTNNEGMPIIPLTITNNFNFETQINVYIRGLVQITTPDIPVGQWAYVTDASGDVAVVPTLGQGNYQTVSFAVTLGAGRSATINFPQLTSARIYLSFGPITICCSSSTAPQDPAGWSTSDPNYYYLFDWVEPNWSGNELGGNTTQVDMFGLPMVLTLNGDTSATIGSSANRRTILNTYQQLGAPWTSLVTYSNNVLMRVVAPYHGIESGVFPSDILDSYIGQVYSYYAATGANRLQVQQQFCDTNTYSFQASTSSSVMTFTENGASRFQILQPNTLTVYQNNIQPTNITPPDPQSTALYTCLANGIAAKLGGAFVRTNLLANSNLDACQTSQFYVTSPIQKYAQLFHQYATNNLAYAFGYDDTCNQSGYTKVTNPTSMSIAIGGAVAPEAPVAHDFNFDGISDIAWRNTAGDTAVWLMNGAQVAASGGFGNVPLAWSIVGQRDFNGDGFADLLWRDSAGNTAIWFLDGTGVFSSASFGQISTAWTVVGTGDFNGDGLGDILWQDSSGNVAVWLMNGGTVIASATLGNVSGNWTISGTGDFNGDGKCDIVWREVGGTVAIWFINGTQVTNSANLGSVSATWSIVGTGDFNDDGKYDLLWRDSSGIVAIWLLNGGQILDTGSLGSVSSNWSIAETGDFNSDGKSDLLWRDSGSGNVALWFINGVQIANTALVATIGSNWIIQGANAD